MDIVVCLKEVPDPEHFAKITLDPQTGTIKRAGIPSVINPLDKHALEEALRIRERLSAKITVISMGPPQTTKSLEDALAMGADDAVLLCDPAFAGADTLATAYTLAGGIQKLGIYDLILCGNESVDGATGQVGAQLAELLGIPHVSYVTKAEFTDHDNVLVTRSIEHGHLKLKARLPLLLAVTREINQYRLPTALGIMAAAGKEIKTWTNGDLGLNPDIIGLCGSPTQVTGCSEMPSQRGRGDILQGKPEEIVMEAIKKLRELGAVQ